MTEKQYKRFYVDWWNIKKSTVYGIIAFVMLVAAIGGGIWYANRNNWFAQQELIDAPTDAGKLVSFEGDVRVIRSATRETILVTKLIYVSAGDTIQTQSDGRATVQMIDGSTLQVRPNSTVVIRDSSSLFGGKHVRVALDDGQINVKTQDQTETTRNVVEVSQTENRVLPQTDASFNTNPATNGGEIRISRGGVETSVGGGEKTVVGENEFVAVSSGKIASKEKLLDAPKLNSPENSAQISGAESADVTFRWQNGSDASRIAKYYLQVSRSPVFASDGIMVDRDSLTTQSFPLASVAPGTYYWRLRATSDAGQTSVWSDPWKFTVLKRDDGKLAASDWKIENLGGGIYIISGKTQAGAIVRSQGREVFAAGDGAFRLQISAPSVNATVEVRDEKGSRSSYNLALRTGNAVRQ